LIPWPSLYETLNRACRVTEIEGIGERLQPKEPQVLFLG
jgi:hypothetical protein